MMMNNRSPTPPAESAASRVLTMLQREYLVIGKSRVRVWYAWLSIGLIAGVATGVVLVANRSGEIEGIAADTRIAVRVDADPILPRYDGLSWSDPQPYHVVVLEDVNTLEEIVFTLRGTMITAESGMDISREVREFYDAQLLSLGFQQRKLLGDPLTTTFWVAQYRKGAAFVEVQYHPSVLREGSFTLLVFSSGFRLL